MEVTPQTKRSLDRIVEEQIKRWQVDQKKKYKKPIRPVVTISRLPGAGGRILAQKLAEDLKIDLFDSAIVEEIAKNSKVSLRIVQTLDEQDRSIFDDWIQALGENHMWSYEYLEHLTRVVGGIGAHGHAIIVGRGASYILPTEVCLRVLMVAPLQTRIDNVIRAYGVSESEAKRRIIRTESDRKAFIRKYFNADMTDPMNYDLVINTKNFDIDAAVKIVSEAFSSRHWYNYNMKK
ncbi:MAG: cytidylate kinase-like family protein [Syntrophobacterales bacterium]|nr:MAG: cytidylate kinase-like family protein [Syntrophobacterales bacterium]